MTGTWPPYHCATEPKDHRGVAAYCATTPIWIDMLRTLRALQLSPLLGSLAPSDCSCEQKNAPSRVPTRATQAT